MKLRKKQAYCGLVARQTDREREREKEKETVGEIEKIQERGRERENKADQKKIE